jgi:hypothetical protein
MKVTLNILLLLSFSFLFAQPPNQKGCNSKETLNVKHYSVDSITELFYSFAVSYIAKDFDSSYYSKKPVWIIDLTDTLNTSHSKDFYFSENHVYVFSPARVRYVRFDYHNVAVIANGSIRFFKAINCPNVGDSVDSVTQHIREAIGITKNIDDLLNKVHSCSKNGYSSIMRKMWPDDHDLIYDKFECAEIKK